MDPCGKYHGLPWVPVCSRGFPWIPMSIARLPWKPMANPMGSHGKPWESSGNHGNRWRLPRGPRNSLCECRAQRASKDPVSLTIAIGSRGDCHGFPRVLMSIDTGFPGSHGNPWQSPRALSPWTPTGTTTGIYRNPLAPVAIPTGAHGSSWQPVAVVEGERTRPLGNP